jgi:hypothetical protein
MPSRHEVIKAKKKQVAVMTPDTLAEASLHPAGASCSNSQSSEAMGPGSSTQAADQQRHRREADYSAFFKNGGQGPKVLSGSKKSVKLKPVGNSWKNNVIQHLGGEIPKAKITEIKKQMDIDFTMRLSLMFNIFCTFDALTKLKPADMPLCKRETLSALSHTAWTFRNIVCYAMDEVSSTQLIELDSLLRHTERDNLNTALQQASLYQNFAALVTAHAPTSIHDSPHFHAQSTDTAKKALLHQRIQFLQNHFEHVVQLTKPDAHMTVHSVRALYMHTLAIRNCLRKRGVLSTILAATAHSNLKKGIKTYLLSLYDEANTVAHHPPALAHREPKIRGRNRDFNREYFQQLQSIIGILDQYLIKEEALSAADAFANRIPQSPSSTDTGLAYASSSL